MYTLTNNWSEIAFSLKKLLRQQGVPKKEWHHLFTTVDKVLMWDDHAPLEMLNHIKVEIQMATKEALHRIVVNHDYECLLRAYAKGMGCFPHPMWNSLYTL